MFVKKIISVTVLVLSLCFVSFSQKLSEPKLLGNWIGGEDPSEMLIHLVLEASASYLKENPNGNLVVRICSPDEFSTAIVKTTLNPLSIKNFNFYSRHQSIFPSERIFVARSSNCAENVRFAYNQYWFVPKESVLESDEIYSANDIYFNNFYVFEDEEKNVERITFEENINKFIKELKDDSKLEGLIVHNSKSKRMKQNIEKVKKRLEAENLNLKRIKIVKAPQPEFDIENEKITLLENDKSSYPRLTTLKINKCSN